MSYHRRYHSQGGVPSDSSLLQKPKAGKKTELAVSSATRKGFIPGNPQKVNQDRLIAQKLQDKVWLFSVCDGHGQFGHDVSEFIVTHFPETLKEELASSHPKTALTGAVLKISNDLKKSANFDINFSGSTFVSVLKMKDKLWCANVGDSRAILAR